MSKIAIAYATQSDFKKEEMGVILRESTFRNERGDDQLIADRFDFSFSDVQTDEPLEANLSTMVRHKAVSAYRRLLVPCMVEHAGLILLAHRAKNFPGGLTQPMMDALGAPDFVRRLSAAGEQVVAQAVVGYCDGMTVQVFVGETEGKIVDAPKGDRPFYWDTIFAPDGGGGDTYAEICADVRRGVAAKMKLSQSLKAIRALAEHRVRAGANSLFTNFGV